MSSKNCLKGDKIKNGFFWLIVTYNCHNQQKDLTEWNQRQENNVLSLVIGRLTPVTAVILVTLWLSCGRHLKFIPSSPDLRQCFVTCLWLILDVQLYDSGVAKDKSLPWA